MLWMLEVGKVLKHKTPSEIDHAPLRRIVFDWNHYINTEIKFETQTIHTSFIAQPAHQIDTTVFVDFLCN